MNAFMITASVKQDSVSQTEEAVNKLFTAIKAAAVAGVSYTVSKAVDSPTFTIFLIFDGEQNPLADLPEFGEFQASLRNFIAEPPKQQLMQIVGTYSAL